MQTRYVPLETLLRIAADMPHEARGAFLLSMQTGVRISDALAARASDFDAGGFYHYIAKKTGKAGRAPVTREFIMEYVSGHSGDAYIFPSPQRRKNAPLTRQSVFLHIKAACKRLGINPSGVAPHTARKAFAVDLFHREGLGKTMHALQHRDAATTLLYALSDDATPELMRRLERLETAVKQLQTDVDKLLDAVFGDDVYIPLKSDKSDFNDKKSPV